MQIFHLLADRTDGRTIGTLLRPSVAIICHCRRL